MINNVLERFVKEGRARVRCFTYAASLLEVRPMAGERLRGGRGYANEDPTYLYYGWSDDS
eukprot:8052499-Pyramimonas_sp.AAC.1